MMVVDASAIVAILLDEPEGPAFREHLLAHPGAQLFPVGYWEAATRLASLSGEAGLEELETVLDGLAIAIAPATAATARLASTAERAFGKRTPARLNLDDCFALTDARPAL